MDETDLVSYYINKAKDWIFIPKLQNVFIEDDEILDLDSISLDSNEDTWLYSSNKSFSDSMNDNAEKILDNEELSKKSNILRDTESSKYDSEKSTYANNRTSIFSPDSPLLSVSDFQHNSFLNSIDAMTDSDVNDLLKTPTHMKSKSNLLKKVLSKSQHCTGSEDAMTFIKPKTESILRNDDKHLSIDCNAFKKPFIQSVEKGYILHSVENKLFDENNFKSSQNKEIKMVDDVRRSIGVLEIKDHDGVEEKRLPFKGTRLTPTKQLSQKLNQVETDAFRHSEIKLSENDENTLKKQLPLCHSTPVVNENTNRPMSVKKIIPLCQPSPVLLNRYLKYNKIEEKDDNNSLKRQISNEFFKNKMNDVRDKIDRNEMNVSYIKYSSNDDTDLPNDIEDDSPIKSNLNNTYSKSEDILSFPSNIIVDERIGSTYDLCIEDDVKSSASESSLSSSSNKHPLSIKEVEKMAELQELSLKKHIHSSYYAGSSKSSEVSSSNESISAFGPLSSSNEGQINVSALRNVGNNTTLRNQNPMSPKGIKSTLTLNLKSTNSCSGSSLRLQAQPTLLVNNMKQPLTSGNNSAKLSNMFKNKFSLVNGGTNVKQSMNKKESNVKSFTPDLRCSADPVVSVEGEFITVKEIKSRDNTEVKANSCTKLTVNAAATSHIPRPSSKIPMFRANTNCNRYSQSK